MMQQGDLDDLVMESNIGRDNKKGKGILTILALLISILIIVIMMAKMVMGENEADKHLVKTEQESLISPELLLDDEDKSPKSDSENLDDVSAMIDDDNRKQDNEIKEETVEVNDNQEVTTPKAEPIVKKEIPKKEVKKEIVKPKVVEKKPVVEHKPKPKKVEEAPKKEHKPTVSNGSYYIQVGSFANKPSSRFLSVITNSGFNYKLHSSGKLLIGAYSSRSNANRDLPRVKDLINKSAFVIKIK
jgi:cell division protein FtsN